MSETPTRTRTRERRPVPETEAAFTAQEAPQPSGERRRRRASPADPAPEAAARPAEKPEARVPLRYAPTNEKAPQPAAPAAPARPVRPAAGAQPQRPRLAASSAPGARSPIVTPAGRAPGQRPAQRPAPAQPPMGVPRPSALQPHPGESVSRNRPAEMQTSRTARRDINQPVGKPVHRVPLWMPICLGAVLMICLGLFTAQQLMNGYLAQRQREREAAFQTVVNNHPIQYQSLITQYAEENNLQPAFVAAIIMNESSFRPMAESGIGARGLMQLMPETAKWIAGKLRVSGYHFDMMYDPETNIRFGCWYLGYLSRLFRGDPASVAAAYHAGQGQVTTWLSSNRLSPDGVTLDLDSMEDGPTKTYARRVTQAYGIYQVLYFEADGEAGAADGSGAAL